MYKQNQPHNWSTKQVSSGLDPNYIFCQVDPFVELRLCIFFSNTYCSTFTQKSLLLFSDGIIFFCNKSLYVDFPYRSTKVKVRACLISKRYHSFLIQFRVFECTVLCPGSGPTSWFWASPRHPKHRHKSLVCRLQCLSHNNPH